MSDAAEAAAHRPLFPRVLLKISGEALMGDQGFGLHPPTVQRVAREIERAHDHGIEICLVIGGGNIFRGLVGASQGMERAQADYMGMLATVMNALAMQDALEKHGGYARVMSAIKINEVCEDFIRRRAIRHIEKGRIAVFAAGTGNTFFTTDSADALRAVEIDADVMLKATKVDGVYTADPKKDKSAKRYEHLTYDEVIERKLNVMDTAAIALCRDHGMPMRIYDVTREGDLMRIMKGQNIGTLVDRGR